jgi:OOP family OmpA-OmpF porin
MNRLGALAIATVATSGTAFAGPSIEFGGTMGLHVFNEKNAVGEAESPVSLSNSALFGLRLGVYFTPMLGVEGEVGFIPGETREGPEKTTPLVDAAGFTYRGHVIAQFMQGAKIQPFALAGAGLFQIVDTDNPVVIDKDSTPVFYAGAGAKYRTKDGWVIRLDARVLLPKKSGGVDAGGMLKDPSGVTTDFEVLAGVSRDFGAKKPVIKKEEPKPVVDEDPDKDGIIGAADKCANEPEDKDSFQDDDGCPDPDNDNDGIADADDKCAAEPEDKDSFEDTDGCPDPDNDQDGVPDAADKCGDQPETKNGFEDEDGCPDEIPEKLKKFTGVIQGITFKVNSVELIGGSSKTLDAAAAVLTEFKDTKLEIQGHTDDQPLKAGGKFADNTALSQGRADSVKAYLAQKGIDPSRLIAKGYGDTLPVEAPTGLKGAKLNAARAKNRRVEFKLITEEAAPPAPAPAPEEPKAETQKPE